jgi:hypothetical protein
MEYIKLFQMFRLIHVAIVRGYTQGSRFVVCLSWWRLHVSVETCCNNSYTDIHTRLQYERMNGICVRDLPGPMHLGLRTCPLCPMFCTKLEEPCSFSKFRMAPTFSFLISSGSKKKEPRYECLSEARGSHAHKTWTDVSSSAPHLIQMELLLSLITYKCRLRVPCPVRRPMTTPDCVLLKDNNRALVAK